MAQVVYREPVEFTAGDTLSFTRILGDYLAGEGWSLKYELRGGSQAIEFTSTADGDSHVILVAAATTADWVPGDYVLSGYAVKAAERHQIYKGSLPISEDLTTAQGDAPEQTFAQKMVALLETALLAKAGDDLAESQIGESRFKYLTPEQLRAEHGYWVSVRKNEVAKERAKSGLPTGNKIRPCINVTGAGAGGVWPWRGY